MLKLEVCSNNHYPEDGVKACRAFNYRQNVNVSGTTDSSTAEEEDTNKLA
jgi:hypothetical protein